MPLQRGRNTKGIATLESAGGDESKLDTFPAETDRWLARWLPLLGNQASGAAVLELGCDIGRDTFCLARRGLRPVALDISAEALDICRRNVPEAVLLRHDLQQPLPFPDQSFPAVIASLCLHYFDWRTTVGIVQEIRRCMSPGGLLLCRVNSIEDIDRHAHEHLLIEPNFYAANGRYSEKKRYFDRAALDALFSDGWEPIAQEEMRINRYDRQKAVWEIVLKKSS